MVEDYLKELSDLHGGFEALGGGFDCLQGQQPSLALLALEQQLDTQFSSRLSQFNALLAGDLAGYNKAAYASGVPNVMSGTPISLDTRGG